MSEFPDVTARTEIRDGMKITWHQPIAMDDGIVLRADVFAPIAEGAYPAILTYGVYAKGLAYQEGYPHQWKKMVADHPEILVGSTNKYQNWEVTDPERWIPHGYVVIRVDSRGAGWSPGFMDCNSARETDDLYQCIEWAGTQPWSNGKVGMLGISYYASNQWRVAGKHAASGREHPVGGPERPLPRLGLPRRHPQPVPGALGEAPGGQHPVRDGRAREEEPEHRRVGGGTRHALRRRAGQEPRRRLRGAQEASARRRVAPLALGLSLAGDDAPAHLRQLGRAGDPPARKLQRFHRSAGQAKVAGGARGLALVALLQSLRRGSAEALLRLFPQGNRQRLGEAAAPRAAQHPAPGGEIRAAVRE